MRSITLQEVEYIAFRIAQEHFSFNEPIPDYSTRFANILESCIAMPFMKVSGKYLYGRLTAKASILFYLMIKNHPFQNGNKRIAVTSLLVFLYLNNKWLKTEPMNLYNITVWVAQSPAELKDDVVSAIERYIKKYIAPLNLKNKSSRK